MTTITQAKRINGWRIVRWSAAAALLSVPAIAMRFSSEVMWTASDFVVMATLLAAALGAYEFLVSRAPGFAYRAASVLTTLGLLLLVWMNLAAGIIGSEDNKANWMFAAVIATATGGACIAHFRPAGMRRTMLAAAAAQLAVGAIALAGNLGTDGAGWPRDVIVLTGFYTGIWLTAAALFAVSAREAAQ